jgi:hypothetical protein
VTTIEPTNPAPETAPAPRRATRRRWWIGGGALAALFALAVALAPTLAGKLAPGLAADAFAERCAGRLEVESASFAWLGACRVEGATLVDPEGALVARVDAELPGLLGIVLSGGKRLGQVRVRAEGQIVAGADGSTNLERALALRAPEVGEDGDGGASRPGASSRLAELELDLRVEVPRLSYTNPALLAGLEDVAVDDLALSCVLSPGTPARLTADGRISGREPGRVHVEAELDLAALGAGGRPAAFVDAALERIPVGLLDGLAGLGGRLETAIGERLDLRVSVPRAEGASAGEVELALSSPRLNGGGKLSLDGERLALAAGEELALAWDVESAMLERIVPGAPLAPARGRQRVTLAVRRLDCALAGSHPADVLRGLALAVELAAGDWEGSIAGHETSLTALAAALELAPPESTAEGAATSAGNAASALRLDVGGQLDAVPLAVTADLRPELSAGGALTALAGTLEIRGARRIAEARLEGAAREYAALIGETVQCALAARGLDADERGLEVQVVSGAVGLDAALTTAAGEDGLREIAGTLEFKGASSAMAAAPPEAREALEALLGDALEARFELAERGAGARALDVELHGGQTRVAARAELSGGALRAPGEGAISVSIPDMPAAAAAALAAYLPAGLALQPRGALSLALSDVDVPAAESPEGAEGAEGAEGIGARLDRSRAKLALALAGCEVRHAALADAGGMVELQGVELSAALAPGEPARVSLSASAARPGAEPGSLALELALSDLAALAREPAGWPTIDGEISAQDLPTALADALASTDGLLADLLGERLGARVTLRGLNQDSGTLDARFESPLAAAGLAGRVRDGALVAEIVPAPSIIGAETAAPAGEVAFALTPAASRRLVGSLVPLLSGAAHVETGERALLTVSDFRLPMDGDLSKLSAQATLDLGQVSYALFPKLAAYFDSKTLSGISSRLGPWTLAIENGVARYDGLEIPLAGQRLRLGGACDLAQSTATLSLQVPAAAFGKGVVKLLDENRAALPADLTLPLEISGSWKDLSVRLDTKAAQEVLEDVLKSRLKDELRKGLGGLLGGGK